MTTHFPRGVFSYGIPQVGGGLWVGIPNIQGLVFFVDADNGSDADNGLSPDHAFSTIQHAVDECGNGHNDVIFVFPGTYEENVTVTDKDYVAIVGAMVSGYAKPDIAPAAGVALAVVRSQGVVLKHLRLVSDDSDTVQIDSNGYIIEDCVIDSGTGLAATEGLLRLQGNALDDSFTASEGIIQDCLFRGASGLGIIFQGATAPGNGVGCSDIVIRGCRFRTSLDGTAGIDLITQDNAAANATYSVKNLIIDRCIFADKNKTAYVDFTTTNGGAAGDQSGTISGCWFATDSITTTNIAMIGTAFTLVGCFDTVGVQDGSGID
jgi:hypothetical protein